MSVGQSVDGGAVRIGAVQVHSIGKGSRASVVCLGMDRHRLGTACPSAATSRLAFHYCCVHEGQLLTKNRLIRGGRAALADGGGFPGPGRTAWPGPACTP
jgi:hypothetical protein